MLDTCVISAAINPDPSPEVLAWLDRVPEEQVYVPTLVLAELQRGVSRMPAGKKRDALSLWLEQLEARFAGRWLPFDTEAARTWGQLMARAERQGLTLPLMDSLVAAVALAHRAVLATRNVADFAGMELEVLNPWG